MRNFICTSIVAVALASPALAQNATIYVWLGGRVVKMAENYADQCVVTIHGDINAARVTVEHCVLGSPMRGEIRFSDDP